MINLYKNMLEMMGCNFGEIEDKENLPVSHTTSLTRIYKKSLFNFKPLKWIKIKKKETSDYSIKYYTPTYYSIDINLDFILVNFSKELSIPCEVDENNKIVYAPNRYKDKLDEFFKNESEVSSK